jgi:serine/threonine-protein kinase
VKCFKCGSTIPDHTRFCGQCGTLVLDPHSRTVVVEQGSPEDELERLRMVLSGEFAVEREIARGGMGVVYEARDAALGRRVALKVLAPNLAISARSAERFKREARTVAELEHPNIVPVYRVGAQGGILYIAMKFVEGRPLDGIIKEQGALPLPVVLYILRAAARALTYGHERGIVHRDVKGDNLLVDRDGRVLVSDFGVALRASDVTLTQDGTVIGTPAFMSPEQCSGKRASPQSDQYSLGVVGFEMLAGAVPFDSDTLAGFIRHHLSSLPPDLRLVRDNVPEPLLAVIERALAKDPSARFATTRAMLEAIEAIPFTEAERRESEDTLRHLVRGRAIQRVHTRSLPAIPEAATLLVPPAPRHWWARPAVWVGAIVVALGGGLAVGVLGPFRHAAPAAAPPFVAAHPETVRVAAPSAASATPPAAIDRPEPPANGTLRVLTTPGTAEIVLDGRAVGVGSVFDLVLSAGARRLQIRAPGYAPFDTTIRVGPGGIVNLGRVTLRPQGESP